MYLCIVCIVHLIFCYKTKETSGITYNGNAKASLLGIILKDSVTLLLLCTLSLLIILLILVY